MKILALSVGAIGTNCFLVSDANGDAAILDPGGEPERIAACLSEEGLTPKAILLTHGHFDHIGAVSSLQKQFGIPVYVHAADAEMLADPEKNGGALFGAPVQPVFGAQTLQDGETVHVGSLSFRFIHTPGHTRGSGCYQVLDALFTGDTLFAGSMGRTDLYGGNAAELFASLQKLAGLPGNPGVYPGHGPFSALDAERAENPYMGMRRHDDIF